MKRNSNKWVLRFSIAILLALSAGNFGSASGHIRETKRRLIGLVLSIDYKKRTILVREFNGNTLTVAVPKDFEIKLSENSPTMGRGHSLDLDSMITGVVIDIYVLTGAKVAETANATPLKR